MSLPEDHESEREEEIIKKKLLQKKNEIEKEIIEKQKQISFGLREWSIGTIIEKFGDGGDAENPECELFIPEYQRDYKWDKKIASRFIESILLGLPIPYIYIADSFSEDESHDGRIEIIDGSQRIRTLYKFVKDELVLTDLKELTVLEGFKFSDLLLGRQRRFLRESLRLLELRADDPEYKRDLFERINSGIKPLIPMEQRRGSESATSLFYSEVITVCANNPIFRNAAPLSQNRRSNQDYEELVLRFFAYAESEEMTGYSGSVRDFLDKFFQKMATPVASADPADSTDHVDPVNQLNHDSIEEYKNIFMKTIQFVDRYFPYGFKKSSNAKSTSRTRFESIALGSYFAIKEIERDGGTMEDLATDNIGDWFDSDVYTKIISSDASNNKSKLIGRISFVKNKLLGIGTGEDAR